MNSMLRCRSHGHAQKWEVCPRKSGAVLAIACTPGFSSAETVITSGGPPPSAAVSFSIATSL
jgi:hypothetical protein